TSKRPDPRLMGDDPLVMGAARLLSIPLRQLYAALWRAGVLEVGA
ncbi:MAG: Rv1535 family protein, partial [Mycobacterium sp.]